MKIIIRKDPSRYDHIKEDFKTADYKSVIEGVDLNDLTKFIKELNTYEWVRRVYWKADHKFFIGELYWAIFAYLVDREILLVEDMYFGCNKSRTDRYVDKNSYYNTLEDNLYYPIVYRLVNNGFIIVVQKDLDTSNGYHWCHFSISPSILREDRLTELGI
jgi:hypothetical protein